VNVNRRGFDLGVRVGSLPRCHPDRAFSASKTRAWQKDRPDLRVLALGGCLVTRPRVRLARPEGPPIGTGLRSPGSSAESLVGGRHLCGAPRALCPVRPTPGRLPCNGRYPLGGDAEPRLVLMDTCRAGFREVHCQPPEAPSPAAFRLVVRSATLQACRPTSCTTATTSTSCGATSRTSPSISSISIPWGSKTRIRSRGASVVLVDQAAEQVLPANVWRTHRRRDLVPCQRWRKTEGTMGAISVVVSGVRRERPIEMPSTQDE